MATYSAIPGKLNFALRAGDDFSALVDFSISLTGHTMSSTIYSVVTGQTVGSFVTAISNATAGQVNVSMTETATAALPSGTYRYTLASVSGSLQRTYLEGFVEVTR